MIISQKIEITFKTDNDRILLDRQSQLCNEMYNKMLEYCMKNKKLIFTRYRYGYYLRDVMMNIKKSNPYFYEVHSSPLKNVSFRLRKNFQDYCSNKRDIPTPRNIDITWFSLYYDEPKKGIDISGCDLIITLGTKNNENGVKTRLYVNCILKNKLRKYKIIRNYMITRDKNKKYYLIVCMDIESKEEIIARSNLKCVAIDQNQANLFVSIDNNGVSVQMQKLDFINYFNKEIKKLLDKKEQTENNIKLDENKKIYKEYSRNYIGINQALKLIKYEREIEVSVALYCIAKLIVKNYDVIIIGDYVPEPYVLYKKRLKDITYEDFIIGNFRTVLQYLSMKYNKKFIKINEVNTTKMCFYCGNLTHKGPEIRQFTCPFCNRSYNRDINSAINIGIRAGYFTYKTFLDKNLTEPTYKLFYNHKTNSINNIE